MLNIFHILIKILTLHHWKHVHKFRVIYLCALVVLRDLLEKELCLCSIGEDAAVEERLVWLVLDQLVEIVGLALQYCYFSLDYLEDFVHCSWGTFMRNHIFWNSVLGSFTFYVLQIHRSWQQIQSLFIDLHLHFFKLFFVLGEGCQLFLSFSNFFLFFLEACLGNLLLLFQFFDVW